MYGFQQTNTKYAKSKGEKYSKDTKQSPEPDSDMAQILQYCKILIVRHSGQGKTAESNKISGCMSREMDIKMKVWITMEF